MLSNNKLVGDKMKILTICPSFGRPDLLRQMAESFSKTITDNTHMAIILDPRDKQIKSNIDICTDYDFSLLSYTGITITQAFNLALKEFPNYDFYHLTNDDVEYKTLGWDKVLAVPNKISYGDDMFQGQHLCTFPMIYGRIVRAVGWLQQPGLSKYCGDSVWMEIGNFCRCLNYVPEVKIEHHHWLNKKRKNDDKNYETIYGYDQMAYLNWVANNSVLDIKKVKEAIRGH